MQFSKIGVNVLTTLFLVKNVLGSKIKNFNVSRVLFSKSRNNLRTLILSNAVGLRCKVFWPNITIPSPGNCVTGLIAILYNWSLWRCVGLTAISFTPPTTPRLKPAGAYQGAYAASFCAKIFAATPENGIQICAPLDASPTFAQLPYVVAKLLLATPNWCLKGQYTCLLKFLDLSSNTFWI